jgi:tRNA uridine 5-carboxymethylaminomethyl modification enzyme
LEIDAIEDVEIADEVELQIKYDGYIKRQLHQIGKFKKFEQRCIPQTFNYDVVSGFSREVREKLKKVRPETIGQASRISGVTPAAISLLLVAVEKHHRQPPQQVIH